MTKATMKCDAAVRAAMVATVPAVASIGIASSACDEPEHPDERDEA
jgi:hypothetical protein